jgi:hypothetical protein
MVRGHHYPEVEKDCKDNPFVTAASRGLSEIMSNTARQPAAANLAALLYRPK